MSKIVLDSFVKEKLELETCQSFRYLTTDKDLAYTSEEMEWHCRFEQMFTDLAKDHLQKCGLFSESWKKNFKYISQYEQNKHCEQYALIDNKFKSEKLLNYSIGDVFLTAIPSSIILQQNSICSLFLYNIDIHCLPDEFGNLVSLKILVIKNIPIRKFEENHFKNLKSLQKLWISGTYITEMPEIANACPKLLDIILINNKILVLHDKSFPIAERVDLSGNIGLKDFPYVPKCRLLYLDSTQIEVMDLEKIVDSSKSQKSINVYLRSMGLAISFKTPSTQCNHKLELFCYNTKFSRDNSSEIKRIFPFSNILHE
jgi:hypothetical protein